MQNITKVVYLHIIYSMFNQPPLNLHITLHIKYKNKIMSQISFQSTVYCSALYAKLVFHINTRTLV